MINSSRHSDIQKLHQGWSASKGADQVLFDTWSGMGGDLPVPTPRPIWFLTLKIGSETRRTPGTVEGTLLFLVKWFAFAYWRRIGTPFGSTQRTGIIACSDAGVYLSRVSDRQSGDWEKAGLLPTCRLLGSCQCLRYSREFQVSYAVDIATDRESH